MVCKDYVDFIRTFFFMKMRKIDIFSMDMFKKSYLILFSKMSPIQVLRQTLKNGTAEEIADAMEKVNLLLKDVEKQPWVHAKIMNEYTSSFIPGFEPIDVRDSK
jgi:hypothetical protein